MVYGNRMSFIKIVSVIFCLWFCSTIVITAKAAEKELDEEFDHGLSGFILTGQHSILSCESCHIRGIFKGIPTRCEGCHDRVSQIASSIKPLNHLQTNASCDDCHTDSAWSLVRMDHSELTGSCETCHNGTRAEGKPVDHVQTSSSCDSCHLTVAWIPARFDHNNVSGQCYNCHNGTTATGKTPDHIASGTACDDCHSTFAWIPARFDHSNITNQCLTCHNGVTATGKDNNHFVTTEDCSVCHSTSYWQPALYYDHQSASYPGDHTGSNPQCIDCHTSNTQTISWPFAAYVPECAACHAGDYDQGEHENAPVSDLMDCAGSCHEDAEHSVRDGSWD